MSIIDPEDPTLALTRALIARPSVTPDDAGCQQLMMDRLSAAGFICEPMRFA
jgi:succinyl-diaminopimelate desuccinylase